MAAFPQFRSTFLTGLCKALASRTKAIGHRGMMTWESQVDDTHEELTVLITSGNYCIFEFYSDNVASVYVRSSARANRGKILLDIGDFVVLPMFGEIVNAIEITMSMSGRAGRDPSADASVRQSWTNVSLRVCREA